DSGDLTLQAGQVTGQVKRERLLPGALLFGEDSFRDKTRPPLARIGRWKTTARNRGRYLYPVHADGCC
ncbi:MAG TPA: hypothetical protein VFE22_00510, partial [Edaphobacter sp.]|nr:hypothetical protein [Edaphobacter sp.]